MPRDTSSATEPVRRRRAVGSLRQSLLPILQALPLGLILSVFLLVPMIVLIVVSFFDYTSVQIVPAFILTNYHDVFTSSVTWETYLNTLRYTAIVWAVTAVLGFTVAYVLAFEIRSKTTQMVLFLVCTVPFLTSNIIRMISWIPFLGREGLLNRTLLALGLIHKPLEFLLFSDFAVVLAYVHLYVLFMVTPIFNTMMRIDRRLLEAALDNGAGWWTTVTQVILPLSKSGIAIGSIFVVTMVMGDFITVRLMSGGQSASVGLMISNQIGLLQYPAACANAVVLLAVVLLMIAGILRIVDIRKEL
ncbi:MAG TPA: ABC transporter permease [Rhodopila sp.]|uniref:ABC transporter permease n=1 Tax=Rhodopila sp. TaxID=2480087 RepID=UPI002C8595CE|nr:ABC transporter permease [Rhodopila sp.]HVY16463.1 ABC transporter permease [Rhodopila sp.]